MKTKCESGWMSAWNFVLPFKFIIFLLKTLQGDDVNRKGISLNLFRRWITIRWLWFSNQSLSGRLPVDASWRRVVFATLIWCGHTAIATFLLVLPTSTWFHVFYIWIEYMILFNWSLFVHAWICHFFNASIHEKCFGIILIPIAWHHYYTERVFFFN